MKLLIISDAWQPQVNGVVRTYEHLSATLTEVGHTVKVIGPADFPHTMPMPGYAEIELILFPYKRLCSLIEGFEAEAIHIATEGPLGYAAKRYCKKTSTPFTTSYHTHFPDYIAKRLSKYLPFLYKPSHALGKKIVRDFHQDSAGIFIATKSLEHELKNWGFKAPMHRLTRGVDLSLYHPGDNTAFTDLKTPIALYVGRVAIEKSIEDFLAMEWDGSKVVVGDGPSRTALEKKYPNAHFVGKKLGKELAAHYRSADLFVFPSRTDTFGIVLIEAMASGLPVVAYDVTGPKDIITEPMLGTLTDDLAIGAREALKHDKAKERAAHAKAYYTWENAAKQFEVATLNIINTHT